MLSSENRLAAILLAISLSILGTAGYLWMHKPQRVAIDADQCPVEPVGTVLAMFDQTDPQTTHDQKLMTAALAGIAEHMAQYERLALHVIKGNPTASAAPAPLPGRPNGFELCKPADPKTVDRRVANVRMARAQYQREFLKPLMEAAPHLVAGGSADKSPILEAIDAIMWSHHFRPTVPSRTLELFSDLVQNSDTLTHRQAAPPTACAVLRSALGRRLASHSWSGVRVILHYLRNGRDARFQGHGHLKFWTDLFHQLGVAAVTVDGADVAKPTESCGDNAKLAAPARATIKNR